MGPREESAGAGAVSGPQVGVITLAVRLLRCDSELLTGCDSACIGG